MTTPETGSWLTNGDMIFEVEYVIAKENPDTFHLTPDPFHLTGIGTLGNGRRYYMSVSWPNDSWRQITYYEAQEELALFALANL